MAKQHMDKLNSLHHYVPQFYLKNFASRQNGKKHYIFAYGKDGIIFEPTIENAASERGFYNAELSDTMEKTDMIEEGFAKIEDFIAPILQKVIDTNDPKQLTDSERANLDYFFTLLYVRTPSFRNQQLELYKQMGIHTLKFLAADKEHLKSSMIKAGIDIKSDKEVEDVQKSVRDFDKNFNLSLSGGESGLIKSALENAAELAPCFYMKELTLINTKGKNVFITSDNPTILIPRDYYYGKGLLHSAILIPITPSKCLVYDFEPWPMKLGDTQIIKINKCAMFYANRFIYSNLKSKRISNNYRGMATDSTMKTKSFIAPNNSLLMTTHENAPFLVVDIINQK